MKRGWTEEEIQLLKTTSPDARNGGLYAYMHVCTYAN